MAKKASVYCRWAVLLWIMFGVCSAGLTRPAQPSGSGGRPTAIWPSGPLEVVAAFEQAVDPAIERTLVGLSIPYFVVGAPEPAQRNDQPAGTIRIAGARLRDDRRTLVLLTDPHPRVARYQIPFAPVEGSATTAPPQGRNGAYDLSGVEVIWSPDEDPAEDARQTIWWPALDFALSERLTRGSKRHEDFVALLSRPGRLVINTLVRLPAGDGALSIDASGMIEDAVLGDTAAEPGVPASPGGRYKLELPASSKGDALFLSFSVRTGEKSRPFTLAVSYQPAGDRAVRAIGRDQLLIPWAPLAGAGTDSAPLVVPNLAGGDPVRGEKLFTSDQARCSQCHAYRGKGGKAGPDLTRIGQKGRAEIYRSIAAPSGLIEPEYMTYTIATKDGQVIAGIVRAEDAVNIRVTDTLAHAIVVPRNQIQEIRPSATSIMPAGLAAALGDAAVRDLIAFLCSDAQPEHATATP
jgi:putative heme-binding domain-containing protein